MNYPSEKMNVLKKNWINIQGNLQPHYKTSGVVMYFKFKTKVLFAMDVKLRRGRKNNRANVFY